jgi:DNA-binding transcriptional MocR family regulator
MLATAPNRNSLPERRHGRQSEKSQTRARCAARLAVITDKRLPMGARSLYVLLDDYAGAKGVAWPKQQTLAHRLGASRQAAQRWIAELERRGWLAIERTGRAHRYTLRWAIRASDSATGGHRISICQPVVIPQSEAAPAPPAPPVEQAEPATEDCSRCGNTGWYTYDIPAQIGAGGRRIAARSWRGWCGCRPKNAILRECEIRGNSDT